MDIRTGIKQILKFIRTALLLEIAVYLITGLICWYQSPFTLSQFALGLSWAGLGIVALSGIMFISAKPRTWRPGLPSESRPGENPKSLRSTRETYRTFGDTFLGSVKPLIGFSGMTPRTDGNDGPGADKSIEKLTPIERYYYSGLGFLVGMMTILSSEILYRGLQGPTN